MVDTTDDQVYKGYEPAYTNVISAVDGRPVRVNNVVVSTQHADSATQEQIIADVTKHVIIPTLPESLFDPKSCHCNQANCRSFHQR